MDNYRKVFLFFAFLTVFFGSVAAQEASAAILYVSTTGSDASPGSISAPVATLRKAHELASPGDTIYMRGGTYTHTRFIWIDKAGISISSYPGENAIINASTSDETNVPYVLFLLADNQSLMNIEVRGGYYYAVKIESNRNCVVRNAKIGGSGRDCIKTFNADNLLIEKCEIGPSGVRDASNAEGVDAIGSIGVTIRDNYVHDIATCGLYLKGGARNGVIERNRVERCGQDGILLGQDTDEEFMRDGTPYECLDSVCRNNVVTSVNGSGVGTYSGSNVRFENNTLVDVAKVFHGGLYCVNNSRDIPARQVKFKNNIVVVNSGRPLFFVINPGDGFTSNSNIYYKPAGGMYRFSFESPAQTFYWESFEAWQVGMGVDGRSLVNNPMLDEAHLCQPLAGSPAIDGGEQLENPLDYELHARPQGAAFDIGAHEKMASGGTPNQPPTVSITATPTIGTAPLNVAFTSSATDPEGQLLTYAWQFGDGLVSSATNPSHLYQTTGVYTARCTVTDAGGAMASTQVVITVSNGTFQEPLVNMVTPDGGEVIDGGSTYTIRWTATGTGLGRTDVAYSMDGGQTWTDITNSLTFITSLDWVVPNVKGKAFRMRVVVYGPRGTGQDMSARNFQIVKVKKPLKKAKNQPQ